MFVRDVEKDDRVFAIVNWPQSRSRARGAAVGAMTALTADNLVGHTWHSSFAFEPIWNYHPFIEFLKPKG